MPPNATGVINSTETGNVTINIQPNGLSINQGQAFIMTEDGAEEEEENATITFVLLVVQILMAQEVELVLRFSVQTLLGS
jgi:hypothetical protein